MRIATNGGVERDNKILELSLINDSLQKDVLAKDREIRRLNNDLKQYEHTMARMRDDMNPDVFKKDAEVMAGMCCTGTECGDLVPVKDIGELLREETSKYRERLQNMEVSLKSSSVKLRAVHKVNLGLIEELNSLRRVCIAVEMERRDLRLKLDLEGQIVKQMVRQLRQAKAKLQQKGIEHSTNEDLDVCVATSTPDGTQVLPDDAEISIIPSQQSTITISDEDLEEVSIIFKMCNCDANDVYDQTTLKLDTPDLTQNLNQSQNPDSEASPNNQSGNLSIDPSYSSMNQNRNIKIESSPGNQSGNLQITSQSARNQRTSLVSECSPRDTNKNQESTSSQSLFSLHRYAIPTAGTRDPSERLQSDSSKSARNQSTNLVYNDESKNRNNVSEDRPKKRRENLQSESGQGSNIIHELGSRSQIDDQSITSNQSQSTYYVPEAIEESENLHRSSSQSRNVITESNFTELSENLRSDSERRPRYPSRYVIDPGVKLEHGSRSPRNKKTPSVPLRNQNDNPPEQNPSSINTNSELKQSHSQSKDDSNNEEHLTKEASSMSESDKVNNAEGCQCTCLKTKKSVKENDAAECQCQCTCEETKASKNLTVDHRRWLITPEGIMRGLEALKQSFLGRAEDSTSNTNDTGQAGSSSKDQNSGTNHRKKCVRIQEPVRNNKCFYCDPSESCEEGDDGCVCPTRDRDVQKPERKDGTQGSKSVFFLDNLDVKSAKLVKKEPEMDSGGSSCAGACEQYYRDKLLATLQILENKEETIRVQGSSLAVAGDRIAELTRRGNELRQELEHKARELSHIRQSADSRVDMIDVSVSAEMKEAAAQKHLVETLEDNLSTVIELYRECFYETAKQEELIEMLRKSYLDVRLTEKDKTEKITRLQNVINTQKRSIEQCQDVVLEVESLKSEISSFLNSSNNDSGMWERGSESPDVGEELADILEQLRQLQQMLTGDCTCGLKEEFSSLKEQNRALEVELEKQRERNDELGGAMKQILDQQYEKQIKEKERELQEVVKKLADMEDSRKERDETCENLTRQLKQANVMLNDKTAELAEAQRTREAQESTVRRLQQDLVKSEQLVQEGLKKLSEVAQSRSEVLLESQARISELEQRLRHASRRCRELEASCREREACLEEAHARGARLCEESRRVTAGVKQWMREKKQLAREQQETIKMQKLRIRELERCLGVRRNVSELTSQSDTDPCCSNSTDDYHLTRETSYRCPRPNPTCRSETATFPRGPTADRRGRENETASCSKCASNRKESTSEMASCSQAPVPPRRKKRQSCDNFNYRHASQASQPSRDRYEPNPDIRWSRLYSRLRHSSPTDEVLERVEHLHAALSAGQRRWGRPRR